MHNPITPKNIGKFFGEAVRFSYTETPTEDELLCTAIKLLSQKGVTLQTGNLWDSMFCQFEGDRFIDPDGFQVWLWEFWPAK